MRTDSIKLPGWTFPVMFTQDLKMVKLPISLVSLSSKSVQCEQSRFSYLGERFLWGSHKTWKWSSYPFPWWVYHPKQPTQTDSIKLPGWTFPGLFTLDLKMVKIPISSVSLSPKSPMQTGLKPLSRPEEAHLLHKNRWWLSQSFRN